MEDSMMDIEETEGLELNHPYFQPSYVLIGIDTNSAMFERDGTPSFFRKCMMALYSLCDGLLLATDKRSWCPFAVVLFDKDKKASFVDFKDNMIAINKLLKEKSKLSDEKLQQEYMRDYDLDLASFFQLCRKKFKDLGCQFHKRTLVFMTNDPDPVKGDSTKRFTALNEAKNFEENDINFQLIVTDPKFNNAVFYDEMASLLKYDHRTLCEDETELLEELFSSVWFRHSRRKLAFYPFADDFSRFISVFKRTYFKQSRLLSDACVAASDGTVLKKIEKKNVEEPSYGHEKDVLKFEKEMPELTFDSSETTEVFKSRFPIGYTLLYLSDRLTKKGEVVAEPCVIEMDRNEELSGFFGQFWQHCVNRKKVMVCARVMKKNEEAKAVELIPKLVGKNQVFLVKRIPLADELELPLLEEEEDVKPSVEEIETAKELIDKITMSFSSSHLIDESHSTKEKYFKSKLLEEPRDDFEVSEFQSEEVIDEKLGDFVREFNAICDPILHGEKRKLE